MVKNHTNGKAAAKKAQEEAAKKAEGEKRDPESPFPRMLMTFSFVAEDEGWQLR
jgi:hypothetical protein